jgi:hypothetical protein
MVDRRGEDKTSFKSGLILLDFCYWDVWSWPLRCYCSVLYYLIVA